MDLCSFVQFLFHVSWNIALLSIFSIYLSKLWKLFSFSPQMGDIKYYGKRRSIVRRIGSFLPLKPLPKIYVSVTPLHVMTNSMINEETSSNYVDTNGYPIRSVIYFIKLQIYNVHSAILFLKLFWQQIRSVGTN